MFSSPILMGSPSPVSRPYPCWLAASTGHVGLSKDVTALGRFAPGPCLGSRDAGRTSRLSQRATATPNAGINDGSGAWAARKVHSGSSLPGDAPDRSVHGSPGARIGWAERARGSRLHVMNDYNRIARTIRYLDAQRQQQPTLAELAAHVGLSRFHFHRLFSRWAGLTPKDFLQCLTVAHAKALLREGASVLEASLDVGLSGPGRLHDLCVGLEAASPGEIKRGGADWTLVCGFAETPVGTCLVAQSPRGICHLSFVGGRDLRDASARVGADWPRARIDWDDGAADPLSPRDPRNRRHHRLSLGNGTQEGADRPGVLGLTQAAGHARHTTHRGLTQRWIKGSKSTATMSSARIKTS